MWLLILGVAWIGGWEPDVKVPNHHRNRVARAARCERPSFLHMIRLRRFSRLVGRMRACRQKSRERNGHEESKNVNVARVSLIKAAPRIFSTSIYELEAVKGRLESGQASLLALHSVRSLFPLSLTISVYVRCFWRANVSKPSLLDTISGQLKFQTPARSATTSAHARKPSCTTNLYVDALFSRSLVRACNRFQTAWAKGLLKRYALTSLA